MVITQVSGNGPDPVIVRIKELNSTHTTLALQESPNGDKWHRAERGYYIVMESGTHTLPGGYVVEAGNSMMRDLGYADWDTVLLQGDFRGDAPAVFSQIQTYNDPGFVVTQNKAVGTTSFMTQMSTDEKRRNAGTLHKPEKIGWIALPFGQGVSPNFFEVGWKDGVTHDWTSLPLKTLNANKRTALISSINTANDQDTNWPRVMGMGTKNVKVIIKELNASWSNS